MQAGLFIPGCEVQISPVDNVYTHFPVEETFNIKEGRLAEECKRLAEIFESATRYSLILMNESFVSTSPGESLYLAEDIVKAVRLLGGRMVFATHLHELAARVDKINADVEGDSKLISMVAGLERGTAKSKRTYKIAPSPPQGG